MYLRIVLGCALLQLLPRKATAVMVLHGGANTTKACTPALNSTVVSAYVADPDDCAQYYVCTKWFQSKSSCPDGEHFSVAEQKCVIACEAGCDDTIECPTTTTTQANISTTKSDEDAKPIDEETLPGDDGANVGSVSSAEQSANATGEVSGEVQEPNKGEEPLSSSSKETQAAAEEGGEVEEDAKAGDESGEKGPLDTSDDTPADEPLVDSSEPVEEPAKSSPPAGNAEVDEPAAEVNDASTAAASSSSSSSKLEEVTTTTEFNWKDMAKKFNNPPADAPVPTGLPTYY